MTDGEHADHLRRWLADDLFVLNTVFLLTASSLAIALTSCLWHHIHPDNAPSIFSTALSSFHTSALRTVPKTTQQPVPPSSLAPEQKDHKSTRSKERRRRGKDPFRDLLKGGKKSKALLKTIKATDDDHPTPSADTLSTSTAPENDTASSTSRSQSPEPSGDLMELDHRVPRLCAESDDSGAGNTAPDTSSTSTITSSSDVSDRGSSDVCSWAEAIRPHSVPPDSMTSADTQVNISTASTVMEHASEDALSSPPVSTACSDICMPQARNSQAASTTGGCANLVRARTRLRLSRMEPSAKLPLLLSTPSALPDSAGKTFPSMYRPLLSIVPSTHSTDGAGPSTPTNSRGPTPSSQLPSPSEDLGQGEPNTQPLDQSAASAQIQLASMHGALETARLREEQLRKGAEQVTKERDELRWRWNEDAGLWRRREAELQAHIHYLMQQLQAYAAVASFQAQQVSNSGFSSPTSPHAHAHPSPILQHHHLVPFPFPPAIQTQNSAGAPAHVQALLASAPMLTSHPPGFAAPVSTSLYPGMDHGKSPLSWSGLGLCVPQRDQRHGGRLTPDSSASGTSSRGRQRRRHAENVRSASDESSLGDWDGMEDGSGDEDLWEEEDDIFRNNALADAILKRPESIRGLGGSDGKRSGNGRVRRGGPPMHGMGEVGRGVGERMDAPKDPALEQQGFVPPFVDTPTVRTVADALDKE